MRRPRRIQRAAEQALDLQPRLLAGFVGGEFDADALVAVVVGTGGGEPRHLARDCQRELTALAPYGQHTLVTRLHLAALWRNYLKAFAG